jgi:type IX secretion system PorP/SprF family membrane protein
MKQIILIAFLFGSFAKGQHVPILNQYLFNGVALNPAFTGNEDALSLAGSFRAQWVGIDGAPLTQSFVAHTPLKGMNSAVGVQFYADQIGVDRNSGVFGSYAYRLKMKDARLSFGLSAGVKFVRSFYSNLSVPDSDDLLIMNDSPLGVLPNVSFGMHYAAPKYFVSFSLPMFLSHDFIDLKFKVRNSFRDYNFMLGGGYLFELKNNREIKPSFLLKYRIGSQLQADINVMTNLHPLIDVGLSYRTGEAIVGLVNIKITKQFSLMYSFGMPLSALSYKQFGSHEIGLKYNFKYQTPIANPRFLGW